MTLDAKESPLREVGIRQTDETQGFRNREGFTHEFDAAPSAGNPKRSHFDVAWKHAVDLIGGDYYAPAAADERNRLWVEIMPNLPLHAIVPAAGLGVAVAATDTEMTVNPQAKGALDGVLDADGRIQRERVYVRVGAVPADPMDWSALKLCRWDSANSKLISYDGSPLGFTGSAGAQIFITNRWEDGSYIAPGARYRIGDETSGSSNLPADTVIRFVIENNEIAKRRYSFNLTYYHD